MKIFLVTISENREQALFNWNSKSQTANSNLIKSVARLWFQDKDFIYPSKEQIKRNFNTLGEAPTTWDLVLFKIANNLDYDTLISNPSRYLAYKNLPISWFVCITKELIEPLSLSFPKKDLMRDKLLEEWIVKIKTEFTKLSDSIQKELNLELNKIENKKLPSDKNKELISLKKKEYNSKLSELREKKESLLSKHRKSINDEYRYSNTRMFVGLEYQGTNNTFEGKDDLKKWEGGKRRISFDTFFGKKLGKILVLSVEEFLKNILSWTKTADITWAVFLRNLIQMRADWKIILWISKASLISMMYNTFSTIYLSKWLTPLPEFRGYSEEELLNTLFAQMFVGEVHSVDELVKKILNSSNTESIYFIKAVLNYKPWTPEVLKVPEYKVITDLIWKLLQNTYSSLINSKSPDFFIDNTLMREQTNSDWDTIYADSQYGSSDIEGESMEDSEWIASLEELSSFEDKKNLVAWYESKYGKMENSLLREVIIYHAQFDAHTNFDNLEQKLLSKIPVSNDEEEIAMRIRKIKEIIAGIKEFYSKIKLLSKQEIKLIKKHWFA